MEFRYRKATASILIALYIGTTPRMAIGGLNDALDVMFNSTAAGAYSSQSRGGFVGGGLYMRAPIKNITLITFDPPRYDAGCGGIDMFNGAFSFINTDQLVQLFRAVAANAVGVLFKAAINAISPQIGNLMSEFQNKIQQLNSLMKNSCQIANQLVKTGFDPNAMLTESQGIMSAVKTAAGGVSDLFKGVTDIFSNPSEIFDRFKSGLTGGAPASGGGTSGNINDTTYGGNMTWKALKQSRAPEWLGNPSGGNLDDDFTREVLMSLVGTWIMANTEETRSSTDTVETPSETSGTGTAANTVTKTKPNPGTEHGKTLSLYDLRNGSSTGNILTKLKCDDSTLCMKVTTETWSFDGIVGRVNTNLFGSSSGGSYTGNSFTPAYNAGSIVSKIINCTTADCGFTATQKAFIESVPVPALKLLRDVQHSAGGVEAVARELVPVIADALTVKFGESVIKTVNNAWSGVKNTPKPSIVTENLIKLENELNTLRAIDGQRTDRVLALTEYVRVVTASNPAILVATPTR